MDAAPDLTPDSRAPRIGGVVLASVGGLLGLLGGCGLLQSHEGQVGAVGIVFSFVCIGVGGLVALFGAMLIGISARPGLVPPPDAKP